MIPWLNAKTRKLGAIEFDKRCLKLRSLALSLAWSPGSSLNLQPETMKNALPAKTKRNNKTSVASDGYMLAKVVICSCIGVEQVQALSAQPSV